MHQMEINAVVSASRFAEEADTTWIKERGAVEQACNLDVTDIVQGICKSAVSPVSFFIVDRFVFAGGSKERQFSLLLICAPSVFVWTTCITSFGSEHG